MALSFPKSTLMLSPASAQALLIAHPSHPPIPGSVPFLIALPCSGLPLTLLAPRALSPVILYSYSLEVVDPLLQHQDLLLGQLQGTVTGLRALWLQGLQSE